MGERALLIGNSIVPTAVTTEIPPAEIIGEDKQDIGRSGLRRGGLSLGLRLLSFGSLADAQHEGGDDAGNDWMEIFHHLSE
jgi:hypothetical protein